MIRIIFPLNLTIASLLWVFTGIATVFGQPSAVNNLSNQPARLIVESYRVHSTATEDWYFVGPGAVSWGVADMTVYTSWNDQIGGSYEKIYHAYSNDSCDGVSSTSFDWGETAWPPSTQLNYYTDGTCGWWLDYGSASVRKEFCEIKDVQDGFYDGSSEYYVNFSRSARTRMEVITPGVGNPGEIRTVLIRAWAQHRKAIVCLTVLCGMDDQISIWDDGYIPPANITVRGQPLTPEGSIWGSTVLQVPAGTNVDVTPVVLGAYSDFYSFDMEVEDINIEFSEASQCGGFDSTVSPPWLMVPKDGQNSFTFKITPSAQLSGVEFFVDLGIATLDPNPPTSSPQIVNVEGTDAGDADLQVQLGPLTVWETLKLAVKNRVNKTVAIHAITEENDDVQVIPLGQGEANQICITFGLNGTNNSPLAGDDVLTTNSISTGADGICQTTASADDLQVITVGYGKPNAVCVTPGVNNFRDSVTTVDDTVSGLNITTGADGICNTSATADNFGPLDMPTAADLENYLNNTTWGRQANVYLTVTRSDYTLNYDLDRNGELADPTTTVNELDIITGGAKNTSTDFNIYFVRNFEIPVAVSIRNRGESWIGDSKSGSAVNVAAHEIGHLLGRIGHDGAALGNT